MEYPEGMEVPKFKTKAQKDRFDACLFRGLYAIMKESWVKAQELFDKKQKQLDERDRRLNEEITEMTTMVYQFQDVLVDQGMMPDKYFSRVEMSVRLSQKFRMN